MRQSAAPDLIGTLRERAGKNIVYPLLYSPKKRMQGSVESWNDIPAVGQLSFLNTSHAALPPGLEAYFKAAVSDDTLYVLAVAKDSHVNFGFRPAYNSDCFELFLDPFFTRNTRSDDSSMQLFITAADPAGKTFRSEGKIPAEARPVPVEGGMGRRNCDSARQRLFPPEAVRRARLRLQPQLQQQ